MTPPPIERLTRNGRELICCSCGGLIELTGPEARRDVDAEWFAMRHKHDGTEPPKPRRKP
jgi:hypothetical protein